jgi:hypothetical protein
VFIAGATKENQVLEFLACDLAVVETLGQLFDTAALSVRLREQAK